MSNANGDAASVPDARTCCVNTCTKARGTLVVAKRSPDVESAAAPGAAERPRIIHHLDLDFAVVDGMQKASIDASSVAGVPCLLLKNVDVRAGLVNGTALVLDGNPELKPLLGALLGETGLPGFKLRKRARTRLPPLEVN